MYSPLSVEYRRLGRSGLRISTPVLGCQSYGNPNWNSWVLPEEKAIPVLKATWDVGITTFDTANMYSNGASEKILGKFIKQNNIPRKNIVIIDKIRFLVDNDDMSTISSITKPGLRNERDYVNHDGLSRAGIFNQVKACLGRLDTDYIDILLLHAPDGETPFEETVRALNNLVRTGTARYIGASNVRAWQFAEMNAVAQNNGWTQFSCVQMEHSLLYRPEELELFVYCDYKGIGVLGHAALNNGLLARTYGSLSERVAALAGTPFELKLRESDVKIIGRIEEVAKKRGWSMAQVALAWSMSRVNSPMVGVNSVQRIHDNLIGGKVLTGEEIKYLEELLMLPYSAVTIPVRRASDEFGG
ncbi:Aldo/keto reductase [Amylostereum chailletii]|nr:Aldo/keto reductase [Amylostereum chailletii]